ncbi:MAG: hypothetical protein A2Y91_06600 [Chloroflexi bacterium RBG_13_54_8]|nr:MAG: hypothetical protein A2Y91_06600 [Chloroflexi bacterium RBG_13_54_8]
MAIDITSTRDCQDLMGRIHQTMLKKGYAVGRIPKAPAQFQQNDDYILEGLAKAILTRQTRWAEMELILPELKTDFFDYHVECVAALTDRYIAKLYAKYRNRVRARLLHDELLSIADNAGKFLAIRAAHQSVWQFMQSLLNAQNYDGALQCYVRPDDGELLSRFIEAGNPLKLSSVGLAICCEFFNNVGIDEFKPDLHTIRFFNRIDLDRRRWRVSRRPDDARQIGIAMAATLRQPRKFVDGHIWHFCADGKGQICTEDDPQCGLCMLKTNRPQLCNGWPSRREIQSQWLAATKRFRGCALSRKRAEKKLRTQA